MLKREIINKIGILNKRIDLLEEKIKLLEIELDAYRAECMTPEELKDLINALKKY